MKKNLLIMLAIGMLVIAPALSFNALAKVKYDGTPYGGTAWAVPGKIQVENFDNGGEGVAYHDQDNVNEGGGYRTDVGVDIHDGTYGWDYEDDSPVIGWFRNGEWMNYTIDAKAGMYDFLVRLGTPNEGTKLQVLLDGVLVFDFNVPNTGSWDLIDTIAASDLKITAGIHVITMKNPAADGLEDIDYNFSSFVFTKTADIGIEGYSGTPYGGTAWAVPGKIQTENFDDGGEGVAYHDQDGVNEGGGYRTDAGVDIHDGTYGWDYEDDSPVIGWFRNGEWMNYTINAEAGTYDLTVRLGTPNQGTKLDILLDGVLVLDYDVPNTESWDLVDTVAVSGMQISEGLHLLTMKNPAADGLEDIDYNFSSFVFTKSATVSSNSIEQKSLNAFPVPFNDQLTLSNITTGSKVSVYSILGSKVMEMRSSNTGQFNMDTSGLVSGIYLIRVTDNNSFVKTIKVAKR